MFYITVFVRTISVCDICLSSYLYVHSYLFVTFVCLILFVSTILFVFLSIEYYLSIGNLPVIFVAKYSLYVRY
jgi:NADH:ubiquinone oxidoreductase subunit K